MEPSNIAAIRRSFAAQAANFESPAMSFSKAEYLDYTVARIAPAADEAVLEVAAGTCACGRAIAPFARTVTCLDITPAMLEVGRREAQARRLNNMIFVVGNAGALPFLDASFDVAVSRLAFHHFPDVRRPFAEMARVLKPGGRLALIDMEAAEQPLRSVEDEIEALRDPSHVQNLSQGEMLALYAEHSIAALRCERTEIGVSLDAWMQLTQTPDALQAQIAGRMAAELAGGPATGFSPYRVDGRLFFNQRWLLLIGKKPL